MSRTDKDKPYWVQVEYYVPRHQCGWVRLPKYIKIERRTDLGFVRTDHVRVGYRWEYLGDCVLPDRPIGRHAHRRIWRNAKKLARCSWEPESMWKLWSSQLRGVHKTTDCHLRFHKPQRNKVRIAARRVVQGDWEIEFPDGRGRRSVQWVMD